MMARALFWGSVLAGLVATGVAWFLLPDRVPMHFGASGEVDRWGSRTESVVWMGLMTVFMALLFWGLAILVPRAPETLLNIPQKDKQWWLSSSERREELNRRVVPDIYGMGAATMVLLTGLYLMIMVQAQREQPALGGWFWVMVAVYLVGLLGYTGYMIAVRYRAPRDS